MLTDWELGPCVPKRNIDAISRFMNVGGAFSVSSGRQYYDTVAFFPEHFFNAPSVQANGAAVWDCRKDELLYSTPLPQRCKEELVEYARSCPKLWLAVADEKRIYELELKDGRDGKLKDILRPHTSLEDFYSRSFLKACFILENPEDMEQVKADFAALNCARLLNSSTSSPVFFECYSREADKGLGVKKAQGLGGYEERKLVCIGDYFNDMSMLLAADIAACPSNAPEEIQAICQIVTCSNNDGAVAELVERLEML